MEDMTRKEDMNKKEDKLILGGHEFNSRFILGSGKYNVNLIKAAVEQGGAEIITLALRRANTENKENILDFIPKGVTLLPNTSGARNAEEAVRIARLSREMGCGDFVKIEIMHDAKYLLPDNYETVKATEILAKEGFVVMPYMYPDLNVARDLQNAGAALTSNPPLFWLPFWTSSCFPTALTSNPQSSPNLCVNSSFSYVVLSTLLLSSKDLTEWSLVYHSTLSYQRFYDLHSIHYDHLEGLHQLI
jgi:hypothetical protein